MILESLREKLTHRPRRWTSLPDLTIAVCTSGERASLENTLLSVMVLDPLPPGGLELLVIDNSRQDTSFVRRVVDGMARSGQSVRYVRELRPGLGFARNAAMEAAQGEIVAFVDDDALVDRVWAWELLRTYRETDAAAVGGRIDPIWEADRPTWLGDELLAYLSILDYGPERAVCRYPHYPFGANISFQRAAVAEVGGFATDLGRGGTPTYLMDEVDLCWRLEQAGRSIYYAPVARVRHVVPAARLTRGFFLRRAAMNGRCSARMGYVEGKAPSPLRLAKGVSCAGFRAGRHAVRAAFFHLTRREEQSLSESRHVAWNLAWMHESVAIAL